MKKIVLGKAGFRNTGILICKRNQHANAISCKTCDGFDYYGKPRNLRKVGTYTVITLSPDLQIDVTPGEDGFFNIFGLPLECEEPDLADEPYVKKGEKALVCRNRLSD